MDRYLDAMFKNHADAALTDPELGLIRKSILDLDTMPSMRALMTAGPALARCNVAGYNCAYLAIDDPRAFDESLYILMCGTGVGFSVERQFINKLPNVPDELVPTDYVIHVRDSKGGWAEAYRALIQNLFAGKVPTWDTSKIRPSGTRLKTFGGRASGPEPLEELFGFTVDQFQRARGTKLNSMECHDIMCKIGDIVVVGGVRRSALISLSNLSDDRMRHAKSGEWWNTTPHRRLANNSAAYPEKPGIGAFMREWLSLYESKSGERGIFNREAARNQVKKLGAERRDPDYDFGCNPCSEIILRSCGFCNLTEVIVRPADDLDSLKRKVWVATVMGTAQASMTNFRYLRDTWRHNAEEEYLLGVSMTGIFDNELLSGRDLSRHQELKDTLDVLREYAVEVNKEWSSRFGIMPAAAITCVKPSGTVSQLVDCASGIHPRHSQNYIRTIRADLKDPLTQFMIDKGFPWEPDVMKPAHTAVFSFPIMSPENSVMSEDITAIEHLEIWKIYQLHWCEHKPSVTIRVRESEWLDVGAWVFENFDIISGISFLPYDDHTYRQAPYQTCDLDTLRAVSAQIPDNVDWSTLSEYETEDNTTGSQAYACTGGSCEITDIGSA